MKNFHDDNIKDLFSTCPFSDRFKVRQVIKSKSEASNSSRDEIHVVPYETLVAGQLPYSGCNLVEIHSRRNTQKKATDERKAKLFFTL